MVAQVKIEEVRNFYEDLRSSLYTSEVINRVFTDAR